MPDTPSLDKIMLAKAYERVEHGREERVSGYMGKLRGMLDRPFLGDLRPASWGLLQSNGVAARELGDAPTPVRVRVSAHLDNAAAAIHLGDHSGAVSHLAAARDAAMYGGAGKALPGVMREHIAGLNQDLRAHRETNRLAGLGRGLLKVTTGADVSPHGRHQPSGLESAIAARRAARHAR